MPWEENREVVQDEAFKSVRYLHIVVLRTEIRFPFSVRYLRFCI